MPDGIIAPSNGEYAQLFCFRIDMVGSELVLANTSPGSLRQLNTTYRDIVEQRVGAGGGRMAAWHGDGSVAFFASKADEDPLIRSGEAAAREILDQLFVRLPDKRFRIGVGTAPARYWQDVETINTPGVVLAARLEDHARGIARGSVLLIPDDVFSALDPGIQTKYVQVSQSLGAIRLHAYLPAGAGELILPAPQTKSVEPPSSPGVEESSSAQETPFGQGSISPANLLLHPGRTAGWPANEVPYLSIDAHPESTGNDALFDARRDEGWIMQHILALPIGTPIFKESSIRDNTLTIYVAEKQDGERVQLCRFTSRGRVLFGDCGWTNLGWQGVFYPQVLRTILPKVIGFNCAYFKERLGQGGGSFFRVEIGNIVGCERKVQRVGAIPPRKFIFDRTIAAGESFDLANGDEEVLAKTLYDKVMIESELDPHKWGYETEAGRD